MRGQSGTTAGTLAVLAVVVAVAVAGAMVAHRRQQHPPLEVVVDVPPPPAKPVAAKAETPPQPVSDPPAGGVAEIVTGSGSDGSGESSPYPDPVIESVEPVPAVEALDAPTGGAVEAAEDPRPRPDPDALAASPDEPPTEARRSSPSTTNADPIPLGDAVVIARRSNLRAEPGPDAEVLAKLETGERAFRLDDAPVQGYYRVYYAGFVGWIWWLNVRDGPGGNIQGCLHCDRPLGSPTLATGLENPSG